MKSTTLQLELLKARQPTWNSTVSQVPVTQTVTVILPPTGTCTTPPATEATVNFGTVYPNSFPNNSGGVAAGSERDFLLRFRNCPRTNISYYFHANGAWVNSAQRVVGLSGSTPDADPAAGNPRGFGIRLQHRSGNNQHTGFVYIHPNELAANANQGFGWYTRNWQGSGTSNTSAGVIHSIPLRAQLVRTSAGYPITPGPFNASIIVNIRYP